MWCAASNDRSGQCTDLAYLAFNFVSTIAVTFINKICFSKVEFGFPAMLCNIHFLVTLLGVEILYRAKMFQRANVNLLDPNFIAIVLVVGIVTPLNNTSLKLNSIGFYQIFKLLVTPCVVLLEYILDRKILSRNRTILLAVVCMFVMVSTQASSQFSHYGTLCALLWVPFAAAYKVQWGRVRRMYNCSTLALMRSVLPYAICVQAAISPLVDPPGFLEFQWTKEAMFWIGLSGICAFLVNFSGFLVMGNIGALAHVLLGQLKTAMIMIGATLLFSSHYTQTQLVGASGAVLTIIQYSRVTIKEKEEEANAGRTDLLPLLAQPNISEARNKKETPSNF
jgi:solute carrier family 35 protein E3